MDLLHSSHQGIVHTKALARCFAWPNMDQIIEENIKACGICQTTTKDTPKASLHPWLWPSKPWSRLHADFAGPYQGKIFLLVVDAYSRWPEVKVVSSMTSETEVDVLRDIFAPRRVSYRQCHLLQIYLFPRLSTTEWYSLYLFGTIPSGTIPSGIKWAGGKDGADGKTTFATYIDWYLVVTSLAYSHVASNYSERSGISPAEALLNRRPKTLLAQIHPDNLHRGERDLLGEEKPPRSFNTNDDVYMRMYRPSGPKWAPAQIIAANGPVSYGVRAEDGQIHHRHIDQLRTRALTPVSQSPPPRHLEKMIEPEPQTLTDHAAEPVTGYLPDTPVHAPVSSTESVGDSAKSVPPVELRRSTRVRKRSEYLKD